MSKRILEDSRYLKRLNIGLWEVGAKRPLKGLRKWDEQTDKQTNKRTYGHLNFLKSSAQRADGLKEKNAKNYSSRKLLKLGELQVL